ncbi:hypothetical protein ACA758_03825 [Mycoplasmopsis agassizii]|uniref:Uncharacterized protein n=1 Tax=Mycoplasmopsis agassizii TaxID=33922 RepID=A0ABX4H6L4_9BACT|nr:hypothetical protein [Mycoplasmopsis agassizii]PAF55520.1 hypothetical protein CJF60_02475 [Mycoplasmopsis agassizii]SMC17982.1 hypothetical protein SAMN02745179_00576 [Mycoplasmopsis agassizii]
MKRKNKNTNELIAEEFGATSTQPLNTTNSDDDKLEGLEELENLASQGVTIIPKSESSWRGLDQNKDYVDLFSQTREIAASAMFDIEEMRVLEDDSRKRAEKIELLETYNKDLNAKPLSGLDSYDSYDLVLNKSSWNYGEIMSRNTAFTIKDLALQTQLYLYDGKIVELSKIEDYIHQFISDVVKHIANGYAVLLNPIIIFDTVRFAKTSVLPITVANPKLMSPVNLIEWDQFVSGEDRRQIIDTFIIMIENALSNGHEVEFFKESLLIRNVQGIHSLFITENAAKWFNSRISSEYVDKVNSSAEAN